MIAICPPSSHQAGFWASSSSLSPWCCIGQFFITPVCCIIGQLFYHHGVSLYWAVFFLTKMCCIIGHFLSPCCIIGHFLSPCCIIGQCPFSSKCAVTQATQRPTGIPATKTNQLLGIFLSSYPHCDQHHHQYCQCQSHHHHHHKVTLEFLFSMPFYRRSQFFNDRNLNNIQEVSKLPDNFQGH